MVDIVDPSTRSRMMAGIKAKNTKPELIVRSRLHNNGFRYRLHRRLSGAQPDLVLPKWEAVVFIHGCFWHRHPGCRYATTPATRKEFWQKKFDDNVERDVRNVKNLEKDGWRVAIIWECSLRGYGVQDSIRSLTDWLVKDDKQILELFKLS